MNFTIIGHTEDSSYHDRCGDYISQPGRFDIEFTADEEKFITKWAEMNFSGNYESLVVMLDGIPYENGYSAYGNAESDTKHSELEHLKSLKWDELYQADKIKKEAAKQAAIKQQEVEKLAREARQREHDLAQLEALRKKLGV